MQRKGQSAPASHMGYLMGIFAVLAVHSFAGLLVRCAVGAAVRNGVLKEGTNMGIAMTGITALVTIPVFLLMQRNNSEKQISQKKGGSLRNGALRDDGVSWLLLISLGIFIPLGINQLMNLLHLTEMPGSYEQTRQILFSGTRLLTAFVSGVLVPAAEELMFRGLIFLYLKGMMGRIPAAFFSALLFAVYHGNAVQGIYAFLVGLILAFVMETMGTLWAPFLVHGVANLFVVFASDIRILGEPKGILVSCLIGISGMTMVILYYVRKQKKQLAVNGNTKQRIVE